MEKKQLDQLKSHALKLLSGRPQSEKEIRDKLSSYLYKKGISDRQLYLEEISQYLAKKGYVDDEGFAKWYIQERQDFKPRSKRILMQELKLKGIDDDIIERALDLYDETDACRRLAEKQRGKSKKQMHQYLLRQGFPWDIVEECELD